MNIHRRLLTIAGPVWRQVALTLAVSLAMSATLLAQAFLVGVILQRLFAGRTFAQGSGLLVAVAVLVVVDRLAAGRTTLVIAHRLSTVRHADRIIVLAQGSVVEIGEHAELVDRQGSYARLVEAQGDPR